MTQNPLIRALVACFFATLSFFIILQFMPGFWRDFAVSLELPVLFYDIIGFVGVSLIGLTIIALKSNFYGERMGRHPWFIILNTLGAFLHLVSFGHYYNPNGIALDTVYTLVGLYGLAMLIIKKPAPIKNEQKTGPSLTRLLVTVLSVQSVLLLVIWQIWPLVMSVAQDYNETIFHTAGTIAGITMLTCFIGQIFGLINDKTRLFDVIYSIGIWCFIINLSIEFNPYTVALEMVIFLFFFIKLKPAIVKIAQN